MLGCLVSRLPVITHECFRTLTHSDAFSLKRCQECLLQDDDGGAHSLIANGSGCHSLKKIVVILIFDDITGKSIFFSVVVFLMF